MSFPGDSLFAGFAKGINNQDTESMFVMQTLVLIVGKLDIRHLVRFLIHRDNRSSEDRRDSKLSREAVFGLWNASGSERGSLRMENSDHSWDCGTRYSH